MDYISKIIIEVLEERFKNDKSYLSEKKDEIKKHKNKFDGLNYLFNKCDLTTKEEVTKILANNGGWKVEEDEIEYMLEYTNKFLRMV